MSSGSWLRKRPWASSASSTGSVGPRSKAVILAWPDPPSVSLATLCSLLMGVLPSVRMAGHDAFLCRSRPAQHDTVLPAGARFPLSRGYQETVHLSSLVPGDATIAGAGRTKPNCPAADTALQSTAAWCAHGLMSLSFSFLRLSPSGAHEPPLSPIWVSCFQNALKWEFPPSFFP